MPTTKEPVFTAFGLTDVGGRKTNEDAFLMPDHHEDKVASHGRLYVVADGTGGQEGGRTASATAVEVVREKYYDGVSGDVGENLRTAIQTAHRTLFHLANEVPSWRSMSTTLVAVVVKDHRYWVAHVGDSRLYLVRGDKIQQITQDHTWAENDENLGSLTRWLGGGDRPDVEIDLHQDALEDGDVLILCTDGLYGKISKDDMRDLTKRKGVKPAVHEMTAIAKQHRTTDNTTAVAIRLGKEPKGVGGLAEFTKGIPRPVIFAGIGIAALVLILAAIVIFPGSSVQPTPTPPFATVVGPTWTATATSTPEPTTGPGTHTVTPRPTYTPTNTPLPQPIATQTPVIRVTVGPTVPSCLKGQFWDSIANRCKNEPNGGGCTIDERTGECK